MFGTSCMGQQQFPPIDQSTAAQLFWQYRWTWIWRTTVRRIFAYDGRYAWSQSDAYQVFVICTWRILHMADQFSWSHWVRHIQVHLYITFFLAFAFFEEYLVLIKCQPTTILDSDILLASNNSCYWEILINNKYVLESDDTFQGKVFKPLMYELVKAKLHRFNHKWLRFS